MHNGHNVCSKVILSQTLHRNEYHIQYIQHKNMSILLQDYKEYLISQTKLFVKQQAHGMLLKLFVSKLH